MSSALSVIIHDSRLEGYVPSTRADHIIRTGPGERIGRVLDQARCYATNPRICTPDSHARLTIMCHGATTTDGHFYLQIANGLQEVNADLIGVLRDKFRKIKIKACGVRLSASQNEMVGLYTALARHSQTEVIAAEGLQLYLRGAHSRGAHFEDDPSGGEIGFGEWEGIVWAYQPNGIRRRLG